jgi:hypothetical protein
MKIPALIAAALLLAACAAKQPETRAARPALLLCPAVPECATPAADIRTNGELADAYLATAAALEQCRIARNTLQHCIDSHNAGSLKGRRP